MSRLAKKPIIIPQNSSVVVDGYSITVKGPKGELSMSFLPNVLISVEGQEVKLETRDNSLQTKSLIGTYASKIKGMITGVNETFKKVLLIEGVGYKADAQGNKLNMALGFSHPVIVDVPAGITATTEKGTITITGVDKEAVGQFAAQVRALKKPEPYKGKGIRYSDEVIRRKQGKKSV